MIPKSVNEIIEKNLLSYGIKQSDVLLVTYELGYFNENLIFIYHLGGLTNYGIKNKSFNYYKLKNNNHGDILYLNDKYKSYNIYFNECEKLDAIILYGNQFISSGDYIIYEIGDGNFTLDQTRNNFNIIDKL